MKYKYTKGTKFLTKCIKQRHSGFTIGKQYVFEVKSYGYSTMDDDNIGYSTDLTILKKHFEIIKVKSL